MKRSATMSAVCMLIPNRRNATAVGINMPGPVVIFQVSRSKPRLDRVA